MFVYVLLWALALSQLHLCEAVITLFMDIKELLDSIESETCRTKIVLSVRHLILIEEKHPIVFASLASALFENFGHSACKSHVSIVQRQEDDLLVVEILAATQHFAKYFEREWKQQNRTNRLQQHS